MSAIILHTSFQSNLLAASTSNRKTKSNLGSCLALFCALLTFCVSSLSTFGQTAPAPVAADLPVLTLGRTAVWFGNVAVGSPVSGKVAIMSTGTAPLVVSSISVNGAGYSVSGLTLPMTIPPKVGVVFSVIFNPAAAGYSVGTVTVNSNSSTSSTATVSLTATGTGSAAPPTSTPTPTPAPAPVLSSFSCANASYSGAGTDSCTATLNIAAPTGGATVTLASSSAALTVPASVAIPSGATSASFSATVSAVTAAQTATLTASEGGASSSFAVSLAVPTYSTLSLSASSIAFGGVNLNSPATQSLTLSSSGTAAVTINSGSLTGAGFSMGSATFPMTLNPGQTATITLEFDPSAAGAAAGQLTLSSNSSTGTASTVVLSGTGDVPNYHVSLSWQEPESTTDPIAGYNVYRAPTGTSMFQLVNSSVDAGTSYADATVQAGDTYDYYVETVDTTGISSVPSSTVTIAIP